MRADGDGKPICYYTDECAALPQVLRTLAIPVVGHPAQGDRPGFPGPRHCHRQLQNRQRQAQIPDQSDWYVGLFDQFRRGTMMVNGLPCEFSMFDQFHGKPAGLRGVAILPPEWKRATPAYGTPSDDAAVFFVVVVP
jgi:hypothetical protein